MNKFKFTTTGLLITLCLTLGATINFAQSTVFTFQGKLTDSGMAPNATYDIIFRLFDDPAAGSQIGSSINNPSVQSINGIFTAQLDFGGAAFSGADRYLEINIRPTGNSGGYTQLLPRQRITSAPQAIRSLNAANADNATNASNATNATQLGGVAANQYVLTGDSRLSDARTPTAGSGSYIQNTTLPQTSTNFSISGNGTAGGTLSGNIINAAAQYNIGGNRVLSVAGTGNLSAGINAGRVSTGSYNSFVGYDAGNSNTIGNSNSFVGYDAGYLNTTGNYNSFAGYLTGRSNTTGNNNSFFGYNAGYSNTTSSYNSFFGASAGIYNTTGFNNSFFGASAGGSTTTGSTNSFFGNNAGLSNTTGESNSFVGDSAGRGNTTGYNNSFFGYGAGVSNTTGFYNSFFGYGVAGNNTTGFYNSFFGRSTGSSNTTGSHNTILGDAADVASENLSYATAIGAGAVVSANNTIALGRSNGSDTVVIYGLGAAGSTQLCRNASNQISTCSSSLRYKTNIASFPSGLNFINRLHPISFDWKEGGMKDVGFGAEDVAAVNPLFVNYNSKGEVEGVKYDRFSVLFVNAFKEQQAQIDNQQQQIETRKTENQALKSQVEAQAGQLQQQQAQIKQQQTAIDALKILVCANNQATEICREK